MCVGMITSGQIIVYSGWLWRTTGSSRQTCFLLLKSVGVWRLSFIDTKSCAYTAASFRLVNVYQNRCVSPLFAVKTKDSMIWQNISLPLFAPLSLETPQFLYPDEKNHRCKGKTSWNQLNVARDGNMFQMEPPPSRSAISMFETHKGFSVTTGTWGLVPNKRVLIYPTRRLAELPWHQLKLKGSSDEAKAN